MGLNTKTFPPILLSVLVIIGTASASASAYEYALEGKAVTEATSAEGTSGHTLVASKVGTVEVRIECTEDSLTSTFEVSGTGKGTILFKNCTATKPANCTTSSIIEAKIKSELIESGGNPVEALTGAGAEEELANITLTGGSCSITGTYALTGEQICELPKAGEELAEHELVCKKSGSKLKFGSEGASFSSTEKVKITSGKLWLVRVSPVELVGGVAKFGEVVLGNSKKEKFEFETREKTITFETARITTLKGVESFGIVAGQDKCSKTGFPLEKSKCTIEVEFRALQREKCRKNAPCEAYLEMPYERPNKEKLVKRVLLKGEVK